MFGPGPDGAGLREMTLQLLTAARQQLPAHSWLQLDSSRRQLVGLPMDKDARRDRYFLVSGDHWTLTGDETDPKHCAARYFRSLKMLLYFGRVRGTWLTYRPSAVRTFYLHELSLNVTL